MGLDAEGVKDIYDDDGSTLPASPEMFKQTSEMELLDTAGSLGVVRKIFDKRRGGWVRCLKKLLTIKSYDARVGRERMLSSSVLHWHAPHATFRLYVCLSATYQIVSRGAPCLRADLCDSLHVSLLFHAPLSPSLRRFPALSFL